MATLITLIIDWLPVIFVAAGAAAFLVMLRRNSRELGAMQSQLEEQEARFAREAAKAAEAGAPPSAPPEPRRPAIPAAAPEPAAGPEPAAPQPYLAAPQAATVESIAKKLQGLGVATNYEGPIALPVPPNGAVYRLKKGGLVGVLPRLESEQTLVHLARRYDMIICATATGEAVVFERLDARLVGMVDGPAAFR
ncbi:MAG: hypothetical protein SF028_03380 [Candidatus Sumerlaeia bacterium]|nr:hypothetical protein [Candidatus Sumerlaeia bacterium]